ncbi:MAG: hypothetical protein IJ317_02255, partial [Clostridia bacterium]|nr:hypothetical protein [Clostridia bacterium]
MKKSNVMKWANRGLALLFASAFTIATVACDGKEGAQPSAKAVVWTAEGTRKVLQDTDYEPLHSNKKLTIKAFRNEFEAAQIIITPDKDVENYTVALSDLTNANGDVLSKDSFQIYHEKYIEVTQVKDGTALTGGGFYPDALVPYENIVAVGENKIAANE